MVGPIFIILREKVAESIMVRLTAVAIIFGLRNWKIKRGFLIRRLSSGLTDHLKLTTFSSQEMG